MKYIVVFFLLLIPSISFCDEIYIMNYGFKTLTFNSIEEMRQELQTLDERMIHAVKKVSCEIGDITVEDMDLDITIQKVIDIRERQVENRRIND